MQTRDEADGPLAGMGISTGGGLLRPGADVVEPIILDWMGAEAAYGEQAGPCVRPPPDAV